MTLFSPKQIKKTLAALIRISAFSASGTSTVVTTPLTSALATAGDGSVSVPLQVSASNGLGVATTGTSNRIEIYDATSKQKIASAGNEVYGRLTEATGIYTLSYYTLPLSGVETAYTFAASTPIDFEFVYRFDFSRFPVDGIVGITTRNVSQDAAGAGGGLVQTVFSEQLTVTAINTTSNLTKNPVNATTLWLEVNGQVIDSFGGGSAQFTVATKIVTWSAVNAGFPLETTDRVIARYATTE